MPLMTWNDRLSVGVAEFDAEHKQLVAMLNELFDEMQKGRGKEVLGKILDGLVTYTVTHFAHEEEFMRKHNYDGYAAHKKEHDDLTAKVAEVQKRYHTAHGVGLSPEVFRFLNEWLTKHIQGSDKKYASCLAAVTK